MVKAYKKYKFGCNVSLMIIHKKCRGLIIGIKAIHWNPYDGRTLESSIEQAEKITAVCIKTAHLDHDYKGHEIKRCITCISAKSAV